MDAIDFRKHVGKNLQERRKAKGYKSARVFAESIGMNLATYTDYEQGRRGFTLERAWEFAEALDCTIDELAGRDFDSGRQFPDKRQEDLNDCFENLNDGGKSYLAETAKHISADPDLRMEKNREESLSDQAMDAS